MVQHLVLSIPGLRCGVAEALTISITDPDYGRFDFDALSDGPDAGELVLLAHGFPQTKRSFRAQLPALAGRRLPRRGGGPAGLLARRSA